MAKPANRPITRRGFLKGAAAVGAAIAAPTYIPAAALGKDGAVAASERIAMGFIGTGSHGVGVNLQTFLRLKDSQAVALCDVDK
ncbi:MAG: twin-arginine translocation signal domain-containing protein, partial [Phycisphaerales bacterium]|nr:twin-arginine translocation signal domain-containing protein [Phycisphaerales bacterium]